MSQESAGKNRFFNLRGACAVAGIAALAVLLLPRSCGGSFDSWWGSGRPAVAESIRPVAEPETALAPLPPVPAAGPEANRERVPGPVVANVGNEPVPEPVRPKADRIAVPPIKPVPTGDARPARRRRQAPPAVRSFTFSPAGSGGWAQGDRFIHQGEFAILLLEAMRMPRPSAGWSAQLAACTLAADLGCGYDGIVAMRRQTPFLDEEIGGWHDDGPLPTPAGVWVGEKPVMPVSGWRVNEFLTEGEMVEVLDQLGIQVYSSRPEELVSWKLARRVLTKFHQLLVPSPQATANLIGRHDLQPPRGNPSPRTAMSAFVP